MKMTQAQFAVLVLDCAITTVARYETIQPPQGDVLLRLAKIAKQEAFKEGRSQAEQEIFIYLEGRFQELYVQDAREKLGCSLLMIPRTDAEREHAHLLTRVGGELAMKLAYYFLSVAQVLDAKDENDIPKEALEAFAVMEKAAVSIKGKNAVEAALVFVEAMANPANKNSPTPKTSRIRSKKR